MTKTSLQYKLGKKFRLYTVKKIAVMNFIYEILCLDIANRSSFTTSKR